MPSFNRRGQDAPSEEYAALKPFTFHGMTFNAVRPGDTQARSDCPLCSKEGKFYVGLYDKDKKHFAGGWECKVCGQRGNVYTFLTKLWEGCKGVATSEELAELASDRGVLGVRTLVRWGVVKSYITGEWLVPGYNGAGKLVQLYRYGRIHKTGKRALFATPGLGEGVALFAPEEAFTKKATTVDICEGVWDAMVYEETAACSRRKEDGTLAVSMNPYSPGTLLGKRVVVATPGANSFLPNWSALCGGRVVNLLYDNDHERKHPETRAAVEGAGLAGIKRAAGVLGTATTLPTEMNYLDWSGEGKQWNGELPNGCDLRDLFSQEDSWAGRVNVLSTLLQSVKPVPAEWIQQGKGGHDGKANLESIPCEDWITLDAAWEKAMKWTPGLRDGLINMLAVTCGVPAVGEQLWLKLVGPPSCGKSTLCEAISVARKWVYPKDTFSGLFSGYQIDKEGSENLSMVLKINGKTLAIKDADTILQHPNKSQILSQFRALYDRAVRTSYNNKMSLDHDNVNTGVILCGTSSLRVLDDSELGQRFLDYEIMAAVDPKLEKQINTSSLNHYRELMSKSPLVNGDGADSPERALAKRLTGGYVEYLRNNVERLVRGVEMPDEALDHCDRCGRFVAYFRSRPSGRQTEEVHRELSTRLVLQHAKLAYCLAVVLNKDRVDQDILNRVRQVALCTARGRTLEIGKLLYVAQDAGLETKSVSVYLGETDNNSRILLRFLKRIGVVEHFEFTTDSGRRCYRWRLETDLRDLYADLLDPDGSLIAQYQGYQ